MGNSIEKNREYGIDLLKIVSMFMVVMIHVLGQGGIVDSAVPGSVNYFLATFINVAIACAVNCFALTSGYLIGGEGYKFKYRKIVKLWVVVIFWQVVIMILGLAFTDVPFGMLRLKYLMPVTYGNLWYLSAYFCMFFFIPFLNKLIDILSKKSYYILLLTGFILLSAWYLVTPIKHDCFGISFGYSPWWLIYLYLLGAGIKRHGLFTKISCGKAFIGYLFTIVLAWGIQQLMTLGISLNIPVVSRLLQIYKPDRITGYTSPLIVASAIFLMIFFLKLSIPKVLHKGLSIISPLVFQVMIIHLHYVAWEGLENAFAEFATKSPFIMVPFIFGVSLAIFVICIVVDWLRSLLFKVCRVNKIIDMISNWIVEKYSGSKLKEKINAKFKLDENIEG